MRIKKRIAILGSTGSIGINTLDVVSRLEDRFDIVGLSADSNISLLSSQARKFHPKIVAIGDEHLADKIKRLLPGNIKVVAGITGLEEIAARNDVDLVMFSVSGNSCIRPLIKAIEAKKEIALANKEALVSAGSIIMRAARKYNVRIMPVDSEHSAIFQCLEGRERFLLRIYLTGSGGPLLDIPRPRFDSLSIESVLKHPKWNMGKKISVDSATMMNKGLELIEAKWLFSVNPCDIEVLIHPEAIIHSMVEFSDGAILAQLGLPDMRTPIQYALTYPERPINIAGSLNLLAVKNLTFRSPDLKKFPCLELAMAAAGDSGTMPAVLSAADETAVKFYLDGMIKFSRIPSIIEKVLNRHKNIGEKNLTLTDIVTAQRWAKEEVIRLCSH